VLTAPGDRSDTLIENVARAALCGADRVIVREDGDRRGRTPGTIAEIIAGVCRRERPDLPMRIVLDELESVQAAVEEMQANELVVAFCEDLHGVQAWLLEQGATPVTDFQLIGRLRRKEQPAA
jgi:cyanophycin synthetase